MVGGPVGTAVGLVLGHQFDRGLQTRRPAAARQIPLVCFEATFRGMAHVAKADGRVSEAEIRAARGIMARMQLGEEQVSAAIRLFREGKEPGFAVTDQVRRLAAVTEGRPGLRRAFLEVQFEAALADGSPSPEARAALWRIASALGIGRVEMVQIEALLRVSRAMGGGATAGAPRPSVDDAYTVLGVEPAASNVAVKHAYRRLMIQHHPDKLRARGLPESMLPMAEAQTRRIRAAWDAVRATRGLR
jgi:DnaJ like chaperone protein